MDSSSDAWMECQKCSKVHLQNKDSEDIAAAEDNADVIPFSASSHLCHECKSLLVTSDAFGNRWCLDACCPSNRLSPNRFLQAVLEAHVQSVFLISDIECSMRHDEELIVREELNDEEAEELRTANQEIYGMNVGDRCSVSCRKRRKVCNGLEHKVLVGVQGASSSTQGILFPLISVVPPKNDAQDACNHEASQTASNENQGATEPSSVGCSPTQLFFSRSSSTRQ